MHLCYQDYNSVLAHDLSLICFIMMHVDRTTLNPTLTCTEIREIIEQMSLSIVQKNCLCFYLNTTYCSALHRQDIEGHHFIVATRLLSFLCCGTLSQKHISQQVETEIE